MSLTLSRFGLTAALLMAATLRADTVMTGLDPTFGSDGTVTVDIDSSRQPIIDVAYAVAVQDDGHIVVAGGRGGFALIRLTAAGLLDSTFGSGGKMVLLFGPEAFQSAHDVVIQPDGKILVVGRMLGPMSLGITVARLSVDGSLDSAGFGADGSVSIPRTSGDVYRSRVLLQGDGRVIAIGTVVPLVICKPSPCLRQLWIARYHADGSADDTFHWSVKTWQMDDTTLQADGRIVLAGAEISRASPAGGERKAFMVARVNADGTPDTTFSTDGIATVPLGDNSAANAVAVQPDGDILAIGGATTGSLTQWVITRFNPDGTPDPEFGSGGVVLAPLSGLPYEVITKVVIVPGGKFLAVGSTLHDPLDPTNLDEDFLLRRYNLDGTPDATFGIGGRIKTDFAAGGSVDRAHAVAVQPDGRLVAVGQAGGPPETGADFAIARYSDAPGAPDPRTVLDALIENVNGLVASGALHAGSGGSLVAKLQAARRHVEAGKKGAAMNQLSAFIAQVTALVRSGRLTSVQGLALIEQARVLLGLLTV
jgi:uncharacterized delta-60 repeat protein